MKLIKLLVRNNVNQMERKNIAQLVYAQQRKLKMLETGKEFSFKEAVLRLYDMIGDVTISFEYEEMPDKQVTVTIEDKEDE